MKEAESEMGHKLEAPVGQQRVEPKGPDYSKSFAQAELITQTGAQVDESISSLIEAQKEVKAKEKRFI